MGLYKRKIIVDDKDIGEGAGLTLKQSLLPCLLGAITDDDSITRANEE
jgi:hypothetical protein